MIRIASAVTFCGLALVPLRLGAQSETTFVVYHGTNRTTSFVVDDNSRTVRTGQRTFDRILAVGSQVCFQIWNAQPANYKYGLESVVDTTAPALPDLSKMITLVSGLSGYVQKTDPVKRASIDAFNTTPNDSTWKRAAPAIPVELQPIINALVVLKEDVVEAKEIAVASDAPEGAGPPASGKRSKFEIAVEKIDALPKAQYHFNDPKLREHLAEALKSAHPYGQVSPENRILVDALASASELLVNTRDKLRSDYATTVRSRPKICKAIAAGRNTVSLVIQKTTETGSRDTFDKGEKDAPTIEATSRYSRKVVSLDVVTLGVLANDVRAFEIRNDTLRSEVRDPTLARPGLMLSLNPHTLDDAGNWGVGVGVGIGFSSKDVVSDLYFAGTLSFRETVRVGAGFGRSSQPELVKGARLNERIPNDFGRLDEAIQNGNLNSNSWYFVLTIPGLSLVSK